MVEVIALLAILSFAGMVLFLVAQQRRTDYLRNLGRCLHCGYDLRASTDRCPECGQPTEPKQAMTDDGGLFDDVFATQPIVPRTPSPDERLVAAATTSNPIEAGFLVRLLEHRGITASIEGPPRPTDYQPVKMRVMVWSGDEAAAIEWVAEAARRQKAREVLRRMNSNS